ncbi:MAG: hypothetical protein KKB70_03495 [Proteobacteria bacterium]|nr:hypothetical protein [Pseudomonadota bacterium]MBU1612489.1 hypothetical protein [Pseudomonadota bacterium]
MNRSKKILLWGAGLLGLLLAAYLSLTVTATAVAEMKVKEFFAGMQDVVSTEYGAVEVSLFDMSATVKDLRMEIVGGAGFSIEEFELTRFEQQDNLPVAVTVAARGVRISLDQEALTDTTLELREMGYDTLALDYSMDFDYDRKSREFRLDDLTMCVREAGELSIRLRLSNVDLAALMQGGPGIMFLAVDYGELRYEDHSLLKRILESIAREEQTGVEEVVATLEKGMVEQEAQAKEVGDEFTIAVLAAFRGFLHAPTAIAVRVEPPEPVAFMQLMAMEDPLEVLQALNLNVFSGKEKINNE